MNHSSALATAVLTMSSREIADLTGKDHKNVIRDIRSMLDDLAGDGSDLSHVREDKDARGYTAAFHLDRELTDTLLTGYSAVLRRKVIARWHELEGGAHAVPQTLPEALRLAADLAEKRLIAEAQRDEAIRTKALIGSKREASAMATASAAVREVNRLKDELGRNQRHATIVAVEKATGQTYMWLPLRKWCKENGQQGVLVPDARYGEVRAWPAEAWSAVYGLDLEDLFAMREAA